MKLISTILTAILLTISSHAADQPEFTVTPSGLRIVAPSYGQETRMRAFNHVPGLNLVLQVVSESKIEKVNFNNSRIISVLDDTGRDLVSHGAENKAEKEKRLKFWSAPPNISEDGMACLIQTSIFAPFSLPSKNAEKVILKAELEIETEAGATQVPVALSYSLGLGQ